MVPIQTLLKVFAFYALIASLLPIGTRSDVFISEDPSCRATPEMVHDGLMVVTDANCLMAGGPGCNFFELPDCRVCALIPEGIMEDVPSCELLDVFNHGSGSLEEETVGAEDCVDCEVKIPPPLVPTNPVDPIAPVEPTGSETYVPIVIHLPTEDFSDSDSSTWDDSESSMVDTEDSDAGDEQDDASVENTRRLRTQL